MVSPISLRGMCRHGIVRCSCSSGTKSNSTHRTSGHAEHGGLGQMGESSKTSVGLHPISSRYPPLVRNSNSFIKASSLRLVSMSHPHPGFRPETSSCNSLGKSWFSGPPAELVQRLPPQPANSLRVGPSGMAHTMYLPWMRQSQQAAKENGRTIVGAAAWLRISRSMLIHTAVLPSMTAPSVRA
jgi:hypothetical protein